MSPGVPTVVITNAASIGLTLGLASFVYELLLREAITRETLEMVGVRENISSVGLRSVGDGSEMDWDSLLGSASKYSILLMDPLEWARKQWEIILESGRSRPVRIEIFLPDTGSPTFPNLAAGLGVEQSVLAGHVTLAARLFEDTWKQNISGERPLRRGSVVNIRPYDELPSYELFLADDRLAAIFDSSFNRQAGDKSVGIRFRGRMEEFPSSWFQQQLTRLEGLPAVFSNEVK